MSKTKYYFYITTYNSATMAIKGTFGTLDVVSGSDSKLSIMNSIIKDLNLNGGDKPLLFIFEKDEVLPGNYEYLISYDSITPKGTIQNLQIQGAIKVTTITNFDNMIRYIINNTGVEYKNLIIKHFSIECLQL